MLIVTQQRLIWSTELKANSEIRAKIFVFCEHACHILRQRCMRAYLLCLLLISSPVVACPNAQEAAISWGKENLGDDEADQVAARPKVTRINSMVWAAQFTLPKGDDDDKSPARIITALFAGNNCEFLQQWDGEIAEVVESGKTKYILIRTENNDGEESNSQFQFVTATPEGTVGNTRDQHGSEIEFSESAQNRCDGKLGSRTSWSRDTNDPLQVIVRERRTDRDEKCRLTEDASTFRYYRLAADHWHLDDGANEEPVANKPTR